MSDRDENTSRQGKSAPKHKVCAAALHLADHQGSLTGGTRGARPSLAGEGGAIAG
jgi:hypothetical protein